MLPTADQLTVIHPHLILRNRHGQNAVRNLTQRFFTLRKANTVLFRFVQRNFKEAAGRFTAVTTSKGLYKITWLNIRVRYRQRVFTRLTGTASR